MSAPTQYVLEHTDTKLLFRMLWKGVPLWTSERSLAQHFDFITEASLFALNNNLPNCKAKPVSSNENSSPSQA